jgi:hypothetical protein
MTMAYTSVTRNRRQDSRIDSRVSRRPLRNSRVILATCESSFEPGGARKLYDDAWDAMQAA